MRRKIAWLALTIFKASCSTVIFFCAVFTVYAIGPSIETRLAPVVSKLQILSIRPTADGQTEITAAFQKLRDCEYIGVAWFAGSREDGFERVAVQLMRQPGDTSSPSRPVGYQKAGPWVIGVPPDVLKTGSFAQLFHRCHPFWTSTTDFYP